MSKAALKVVTIGAAALAAAIMGNFSLQAAPGLAGPGAPAAAPTSPQASTVSAEVACNRARVTAHDAWAEREKELQREVDGNQAVIDATDPKRLPPAWMVPDGTVDQRIKAMAAAPLLAARIAAVRRSREASLLGAVFARDGAQAVETQDTTPELRKASAAAWEACRDVAPATPAPCP